MMLFYFQLSYGTIESSPGIHSWEYDYRKYPLSPERTNVFLCRHFVDGDNFHSSLTGFFGFSPSLSPAMNRWAIIRCPCRDYSTHSTYLTTQLI